MTDENYILAQGYKDEIATAESHEDMLANIAKDTDVKIYDTVNNVYYDITDFTTEWDDFITDVTAKNNSNKLTAQANFDSL